MEKKHGMKTMLQTIEQSVLRKCDCSNTFQDSIYGKGIRVMNALKKGGHRCTVCDKEV